MAWGTTHYAMTNVSNNTVVKWPCYAAALVHRVASSYQCRNKSIFYIFNSRSVQTSNVSLIVRMLKVVDEMTKSSYWKIKSSIE